MKSTICEVERNVMARHKPRALGQKQPQRFSPGITDQGQLLRPRKKAHTRAHRSTHEHAAAFSAQAQNLLKASCRPTLRENYVRQQGRGKPRQKSYTTHQKLSLKNKKKLSALKRSTLLQHERNTLRTTILMLLAYNRTQGKPTHK